MSNIIEIKTENSFNKEVVNSLIPVLIDFTMEDCPPCEEMEPALEKIAKEYDGKIKVVRVEVEDLEAVAEEYEVEVVPTLILVSCSDVIAETVGFVGTRPLRKFIKEAVGKLD